MRPPPGSGVEAPEPPRPSPPPPGDGHLFSPADTPIIRLEAAAETAAERGNPEEVPEPNPDEETSTIMPVEAPAEPAEETGNPWDRGETLAAKIRKMKD